MRRGGSRDRGSAQCFSPRNHEGGEQGSTDVPCSRSGSDLRRGGSRDRSSGQSGGGIDSAIGTRYSTNIAMAEGRAPQMFRVPGRDLSYVEAGHVTGVLANQEAGDTRPTGDVLLHEHSDDGGRSSTDVSSPARDLKFCSG